MVGKAAAIFIRLSWPGGGIRGEAADQECAARMQPDLVDAVGEAGAGSTVDRQAGRASAPFAAAMSRRTGTTGSASPWISSTGGRERISAARVSATDQRAGIADDRGEGAGRRGATCSAIMVPWENPTSADRLVGEPARGQLARR